MAGGRRDIIWNAFATDLFGQEEFCGWRLQNHGRYSACRLRLCMNETILPDFALQLVTWRRRRLTVAIFRRALGGGAEALGVRFGHADLCLHVVVPARDL